MKVLYFTKYSQNGASSRLRSYQYFPFLENEKIGVTVSPLFCDHYLNELYKGRQPKRLILKAYFKRFGALFSVFKYDVVVIEKELFPYFFSWFERLFLLLGVHYVVDYDDAIFHNYDLNKNFFIRFFLRKKIDRVMQFSSCVIAGNAYLAERAEKAGAAKIVIVPTVIDLDRYKVKDTDAVGAITIGWIGSPTTFKYVKSIANVLQKLLLQYDITIAIIGANEDIGFGPKMKFIEWTEASEVSSILNFDIGIMPLEDTAWELGKCSYKLIQYMGCGVPVVASSVGMNREVVQDGVNGFLVHNEEEWFDCLEKLILDASLRKKIGLEGRFTVERNYSSQITNNSIISCINGAG